MEKSSESLSSVGSWLETIDLMSYKVNFETNLYTDMERVTAIWDDELTSILDIEKIGHRKRILLSLAGRDGIQHRFGKVKASTFLCHIYDFSEGMYYVGILQTWAA